MPVAVAGKFVSGPRNPTNECRITLSDPAQNEERTAHRMLVKDRQQQIGIGFDATLELVPHGPCDPIFECGDLKVVFDVNRQSVGDLVLAIHDWRENAGMKSREKKEIRRWGHTSHAVEKANLWGFTSGRRYRTAKSPSRAHCPAP